ncbi:MAG: DUF3667 domain-containing protein [Chitinophagaceae bacterium]|nr:MAG: DUF3667 domain-containing protein [Chitinophagaceae bacterium]
MYVSHQPERAEKDCLNCGAQVHGRFCHQCGQENIVTKQSAGSLILHFIYDIFHFDGKFFDTLRYLLFRPGRVAREYISGRRVRYLDPIRMYLFTSALFFLIFFAFKSIDVNDDPSSGSLSRRHRFELASEISSRPMDSFHKRVLRGLLDTSMVVYLDDPKRPQDTVLQFRGQPYTVEISFDSSQIKLLKRFPKDTWLHRFARARISRLDDRLRDSDKSTQAALLEGVFHRLPYLLFVSLPFFALLLKLLYIRRKQFFYADHIVFTLYHYIFNFILLLLVIGSVGLAERTGWDIFDWLTAALFITGLVYLYKGMRNFYGQGRWRTLLKFLALNFLGFWVILLLFLIFVVISAIQI